MKDSKGLGNRNSKNFKKQSQLINDVLNLNKKPQLKKPTSTEPTLQTSEFNLVKSTTGKQGVVHVKDLTKVLKKRAKHIQIDEKLRSTQQKTKTLSKSLEKPKADRIRRTVAFEGVKEQLDRWDAVVTSNRAANQLLFPLPNIKLENNKNFAEFRLKTDLQKELEELEPKVEVFNLENESKYPLTMQETIERRKEMAKIRAAQSYKEAKARRQSKIKSKKFHRIQRREKIKQQMKEFELLQKTNPEEALKKLEEIEKVRAMERANLRHRSTGKWAKNKQVQAKYDKESRQVLAQQLALSRELTQKLKVSDSESESELEIKVNSSNVNQSNPWTNSNKTPNEIEKFVSGYRKFWENKNKEVENINKDDNDKNIPSANQHENTNSGSINTDVLPEGEVTKNNTKLLIKEQSIDKKKDELQQKNVNKKSKHILHKIKAGTSNWEINCVSDSSDDDEIIPRNTSVDLKKHIKKKYEKLKRELQQHMVNNKSKQTKKKRSHIKSNKNLSALNLPVIPTRPVIKEKLLESCGNDIKQNDKNSLDTLELILKNDKPVAEELPKTLSNIDPNDIAKVKPISLNSEIPDLLSVDLEDEEENMNQNIDMLEAFQDDDLIAEFEKDKKAEIGNEKPKDVNLALPGWGSWGGPGIKTSKRKQNRFIVKFPKKFKRRDDNKGNLIINEKANASIKPHLVSEVPFPFKKTKDFEASVRAPIGNTFIPETAFRKMIQPPVITKMGTIIEPMTDDILLKKKK